jgi:hypothetical protein
MACPGTDFAGHQKGLGTFEKHRAIVSCIVLAHFAEMVGAKPVIRIRAGLRGRRNAEPAVGSLVILEGL